MPENNRKNDIAQAFLNTSLREIMSLVNAECSSLFIFDADKEELVLNSYYNSANLHIQGLRKKKGEGVSGKVLDTKKPILVKDIGHDSRFKQNGYTHYKTGSFISVPLFSPQGGLVGLINLADKSSGEPFSEKDMELAVAISRYVCIALDSLCNYTALQLERDSIVKQKNLLEKYASVGKLAAGVVHEVNNPLDGILRYTNILIQQLEQNQIAKEYLLEIKTGLNRIANITKSLLDFSRFINFSSVQQKKYVDINQVIDESLDALTRELDDIKIKKLYKEPLPKILDLGLQHVFVNIIKNALDAMPDGGILEISEELKDSLLAITFKDTGHGIPHEIKNRIFEPFFTTKEISKGTGLGLSISSEIINKYEGHIEVQSSHGEGSAFTVLIPTKYLENV